MYLNKLRKRFPPFDYSKSLENELNETEELFRNPNLLIESIRDMQQNQKESLKEIQLKLNQINLVKVHLKATNFFVPNSNAFNPKETSWFGSI